MTIEDPEDPWSLYITQQSPQKSEKNVTAETLHNAKELNIQKRVSDISTQDENISLKITAKNSFSLINK